VGGRQGARGRWGARGASGEWAQRTCSGGGRLINASLGSAGRRNGVLGARARAAASVEYLLYSRARAITVFKQGPLSRRSRSLHTRRTARAAAAALSGHSNAATIAPSRLKRCEPSRAAPGDSQPEAAPPTGAGNRALTAPAINVRPACRTSEPRCCEPRPTPTSGLARAPSEVLRDESRTAPVPVPHPRVCVRARAPGHCAANWPSQLRGPLTTTALLQARHVERHVLGPTTPVRRQLQTPSPPVPQNPKPRVPYSPSLLRSPVAVRRQCVHQMTAPMVSNTCSNPASRRWTWRLAVDPSARHEQQTPRTTERPSDSPAAPSSNHAPAAPSKVCRAAASSTTSTTSASDHVHLAEALIPAHHMCIAPGVACS